jgi:RNA polymerase sigma factor (sigma-70 family)
MTQLMAEAGSSALEIAPAMVGLRGIPELTLAMAAGNEEAFCEFHRRYFDRLFRFCLVLSRGNSARAGDVLQDTLCRVARYVRRFEDEEVFWCWLAAVARSACQDAGRKHRRYLAMLENYARRWLVLDPPAPTNNEQYLDQLAAECLSELDPGDRALVEGKYLAGHTLRQLAARAHLTEKAVESRLSRLRRHLRGRLLDRLREFES